jgi:protein-tyrosine phosphatase
MKYAITFFLLGILMSFYGTQRGGLWHVMHWPAVSCFALAVGYAGLGPRVFGKRLDGSIPAWSKLIHLPFLLYSWAIWHIVRSISRENPTDQVVSDLIIGRRLQTSECPTDIEHYIDLTAEFEDPEAIRKSSQYMSMPILDGDVPTNRTLRDAVSKVRDGVAYVHCAQGHGRTGLFALALLAARGHIRSVEEGMELIQRVRPDVRLNSAQMQFAHRFIAAPGAAQDDP